MSFGWFLLGTGTGFIALALIARRLMDTKLMEYIESIKIAGKKEVESLNRETSELWLRDKKGDLFTVKIVVDHDMEARRAALSSETQYGNVKDVLSGEQNPPGDMAECKEFVFSADAVAEMREAGIEPDMVVANMLRAAGKIL